MADYDWFYPTADERLKSIERARWREENHVIIVNFSDSGYSHKETYGCKLCGCVLMSKSYLEVHRQRCYPIPESKGKHKREV